MELQAFEQIDAGGVDSRSSPINFPRNRALRCLNWAPQQAGYWQLRFGYATVSMSTVTASAISGMFPYRTWDGHKYVLFFQGTNINLLDTATGIVTSPVTAGTTTSSAKGNGYLANNRFHYGNGTDQVWFDGVKIRPSGLRAMVTSESAYVTIVEGVREFTITQAASVTLTAAAGGTFPADSFTGHLIYVAIFDTAASEIGPATISVGPGRVVLTLNEKITVGGLPNLSAINANWVKLIAGTTDGGNSAWFFTNTNTAISSLGHTGGLYEFACTAHGLSTGDVIVVAGMAGSPLANGLANGTVWMVTVIDANHFTIPLSYTGVTLTPGGTVSRIVQAANATTSVDVLGPTQDNTYQVNQNRGLAASTVGGPNAGYQFAACIYNPSGGGHVGNYSYIGPRALQTAYRTNWRIAGLPQLTAINPEWTLLIGRTGDGAQVPYPCTDPLGNFVTMVDVGTNSLTQGDIGPNPLPTRNGIIPSQCNMFCVAGDFCYAADSGSPYLRRSGDLSQAVERGNTVLGRPEQSWAGDDIDTFPTGEAITGIFETDQEVFCGTQHDTAISANIGGIQQWVGPWQVGLAGARAGAKCGSHGFFWLTADKQLCTLIQGVPVIASEEYELAELSQIGDSFIGTTELVYYRNAAQNKDELRIEGQLQSGVPYTVIHDFRLRDPYSAPGSLYGQGYSAQFQGALGTVFTSAQVRDGNGKLQIYAGASNGQIYQQYSGADDVSNQYTADLILLVNGGPNRPNVPFVDWYGDQNIKMTVGRNFQTSLANGAEFGFDPPSADADQAQAVQGAENDFLYRQYLNPPEVQRLYARFQLTSHSADGNLNLNSPIHLPLENYGRLYELIPAMGDERER